MMELNAATSLQALNGKAEIAFVLLKACIGCIIACAKQGVQVHRYGETLYAGCAILAFYIYHTAGAGEVVPGVTNTAALDELSILQCEARLKTGAHSPDSACHVAFCF